MKHLPKYKTDPKAAYSYAKRRGPLSEIEEKVFLSNFDKAIEYALYIKKSKLCDLLEKELYKNYINLIKKANYSDHDVILNYFFKYIKMTREIPNKYRQEFLNYTNPCLFYKFTDLLGLKLSDKQEKNMFEKCIEEDDLWPITEYQFLIKKVPEYMHNFMVAKSLEEKDSSNKNAVTAYFLNLKKLKKTLEKLYESIENKDIKLIDVINQL